MEGHDKALKTKEDEIKEILDKNRLDN